MVSYHSGWIILLLITYPLQVGTVILIFVTYYIVISFSFALMTVLCLRRGHNQTLPVYILYIGTFLHFLFFLTIYYFFLAIYPHEDSITKFIPSLLPIFFIGFCSWIAKNIKFKVIDYDKENQVDHSNNENPQNSNNENPHESEIVNLIEDNKNTPLLSGNQSTATRRTNLSINSNT